MKRKEEREKLRSELQQNPLHHYDKILKMRYTPIIISDLTLLRENSMPLLPQVVRCHIDFTKIRKTDLKWILEVIKKYQIQVSALLNNEQEDGFFLFSDRKKGLNSSDYQFIHSVFETGLVSE